jgi:hypothetical protein
MKAYMQLLSKHRLQFNSNIRPVILDEMGEASGNNGLSD